MKKWWQNIDQKSFLTIFRFICLLFLLVLILNKVNITLSKYESKVNGIAKSKIAFFVIRPGTYNNNINLTGLEPSDSPYLYQIEVHNFDSDNNRCQVNLEYSIKFIMTTNLPLTYKIIRNTDYNSNSTSIMTNDVISQDSDETYFKTLSNDVKYTMNYNNNITDTYTLIVNYPKSYANNPDAYQGLIDDVSVEINAEQVV
jgi:hypothetical protein